MNVTEEERKQAANFNFSTQRDICQYLPVFRSLPYVKFQKTHAEAREQKQRKLKQPVRVNKQTNNKRQ